MPSSDEPEPSAYTAEPQAKSSKEICDKSFIFWLEIVKERFAAESSKGFAIAFLRLYIKVMTFITDFALHPSSDFSPFYGIKNYL